MQRDRIPILAVALAAATVGCGDSSSDGADASADDAAAPADATGEADGGEGADASTIAGAVSTLAGSGETGQRDGGDALFANPVNVAVDPASGDVLVADFANDRIRRVTPEGFATTVITETGGDFVGPFGLAFFEGTLYAQSDEDGAGGALWEVDIAGGSGDLLVPDVGRIHGLGSHPEVGLILPHRDEHVIELFDPRVLSSTFLAGSSGEAGYVDGAGAEARFDEPHAAIALPGGDILVADAGNHVLRRITLEGDVSTFAGTGQPGTDDGPVGEATFHRPQGLALDDAGTIYVSCVEGHVIRAIAGGQVSTVAGSGVAGFADSQDDPLAAQFFGLEGIAAAPGSGIVYAADGDRGTGEPHHRIRRVQLD